MSKKLFKLCLEIAKNNIHRCLETNNHFSFIIQSNTIVAWGFNRRGKVHKKFGYKWYSNIHSEVDAYAKAKKRLDTSKPFSIINIRLNNQMCNMLSKPCPLCSQYLTLLGCSKVIYSTDTGFNKNKL